MLRLIRNSRLSKAIAIVVAGLMFFDLLNVSRVFGLTSGPTQPEFSGISQVGTEDMVDPFTGDFGYNIPLLEIGGFPVNLAYSSEVSMDQEASWVGLGWSLNTGAITRTLRGLPDDFCGDILTEEYHQKTNQIWGINVAFKPEFFQFEKGENFEKVGGTSIEFGLSLIFDNFNGFGLETSSNMTIMAGENSKMPLNYNIGLTSGKDGANVNGSLGYQRGVAKYMNSKNEEYNFGAGITGGFSFSSRQGLKALTLDASVSGTKGKNESKGVSDDILFSFGYPTHSPSIDFPFKTPSYTFRLKAGLTSKYTSPYLLLGGFCSKIEPEVEKMELESYGYMYSEKAKKDEVILDFNREKDISITPNTNVYPVTNFTYDVFNVSGLGISGAFRAFRNDIGQVYDPYLEFDNTKWNGGIEAALPDIFQIGADVMGTFSYTKSGGKNSYSFSDINFKSGNVNNDLYENEYEPYCFKMIGELNTGNDPADFYNRYNYDQPLNFDVKRSGGDFNDNYHKNGFGITNTLTGANAFSTSNYNKNNVARQKRNTNIQVYTVEQAEKIFPEKLFKMNPNSQPSHIGLIVITKEDGTKYIFGETVYNLNQEEVSFAIDKGANSGIDHGSIKSGLTTYQTSENANTNVSGTDGFYSRKVTPKYAHTFLLTAILSADYKDVNNNGPDNDDFGTYVYFDYVQNEKNFKWRTPYSKDAYVAAYDEKQRTKVKDDRASYIFGEREAKYISKISTRDKEVDFNISKRKDGLGVINANGGRDTNNCQYELDEIKVYNVGLLGLKHLEKTVQFKYDYSLCKKVPNNANSTDNGKLTLRKVYILNGTSKKGLNHPYIFTYSTNNPDYGCREYDRWGNYKPSPATEPYNDVYPYTTQSKTEADNNSNAWKLTEIYLPTGGNIKVEYESDDYAYVQDYPAMEMVKIVNFAHFKINPLETLSIMDPLPPEELDGSQLFKDFDVVESENLYDLLVNNNINTMVLNNYIILQLNNSYSGKFSSKEEANSFLKEVILRKDGKRLDKLLNNFYFKVLVNVDKSLSSKESGNPLRNKYEYVSGYVELDPDKCLFYDNNYDKIVLKLKPATFTEKNNVLSKKCNPISKSAWQYSRLYTPELAYNQVTKENRSFEDVMSMLRQTFFDNIVQLVRNPDKTLCDRGYGQAIIPGCSWARIYNPDGHKLGGGSRVKTLTIFDNWNEMANEKPAAYRTVYDYNLEDGTSSGVAAYEPFAGADEIPLHLPVYFSNRKEQKLLKADDRFFQEDPSGESFFPSPVVGYSRVTMKNVPLEYNYTTQTFNNPTEVIRHGTGRTVFEFYTAKDFPVKSFRSDNDYERKKTSNYLPIYNKTTEIVATSQGFSIVLNDMHGKPKSKKVFSESENDEPEKLISGLHYYYKTDPNTNDLINTVRVIDKSGNVTNKEIGRDEDIVVDYRINSTDIKEARIQANAGSTSPLLFMLLGMGKLTHDYTRFEYAVMTKVINKRGILEKVEAEDLGSMVSTSNLAYDKENGNVILTKTINEFNDTLFSFTYPAHWAYKSLGNSYISSNTLFKYSQIANSEIENYLCGGDMVYHVNPSSTNYQSQDFYWYDDFDNDGDFEFMNDIGDIKTFTGTDILEIINPGRRNLSGANAGTIVCRANPIREVPNTNPKEYKIVIDQSLGIIDAKAMEYRNRWRNSYRVNCIPSNNYTYRYSLSQSNNGSGYSRTQNIATVFNRINLLLTNDNNLISKGLYNSLSYLSSDFSDIRTATCCQMESYCMRDGEFNSWVLDAINRYFISCTTSPPPANFYFTLPYNSYGSVTYEISSKRNKPYGSFAENEICISQLLSTNKTTIKFYEECELNTPYFVTNINNLWQGTIVSPCSNSCYSYNELVNKSKFDVILSDQYGDYRKYVQIVDDLHLFVNLQPHIITRFPNIHVNLTNKTASGFIVQFSYLDRTSFPYQNTVSTELEFEVLNSDYLSMLAGNYDKITSIDFLDFTVTSQLPQTTLNPYLFYIKINEVGNKILYAGARKTSNCLQGHTNVFQQALPPDIPPLYSNNTWRPAVQYMYKTDRTYTDTIGSYTNASDVRNDGVYDSFIPFWTLPAQSNGYMSAELNNWQWTKAISEYSPEGYELENIAPVGSGIYSSAVYGYKDMMPVAVVQNATLAEIGCDNMEDYDMWEAYCIGESFKFYNYYAYITSDKAHTGQYSMKLGHNSNDKSVIYNGLLNYPDEIPSCNFNQLYSNIKMLTCDPKTNNVKTLKPFSPYALTNNDQRFLLSFWVATDDINQSLTTFNDVNVIVNLGSGTSNCVISKKVGPVIEGWCKIDCVFETNTSALNTSTAFILKIENGITGTTDIYIDDVRIIPEDAMMKSYVYNPETFDLMAVLDENNYATFYEYDEEGNVIRIKQETERGIMTIKESRFFYKDKN